MVIELMAVIGIVSTTFIAAYATTKIVNWCVAVNYLFERIDSLDSHCRWLSSELCNYKKKKK